MWLLDLKNQAADLFAHYKGKNSNAEFARVLSEVIDLGGVL